MPFKYRLGAASHDVFTLSDFWLQAAIYEGQDTRAVPGSSAGKEARKSDVMPGSAPWASCDLSLGGPDPIRRHVRKRKGRV